MWTTRVIVVVLVLTLWSLVSHTHGSSCSRSGQLTEKFIAKITSEVDKLPLSDFEQDGILTLKVDRANSISSYSNNKPSSSSSSSSQSTKPLYSHGGIDSQKQTVVLHAGNSAAGVKYEKRRFVVLRQRPTNPKQYFAAFAYVRNAESTDKSKFTVDGGKAEFSIEFAPWDSRDDDNDERKGLISSLGWTKCRETILVPCSSNETLALQMLYSSEKMANILVPTSTTTTTTDTDPSSPSIIIISDGQEVQRSRTNIKPTKKSSHRSSSLKIMSADPGWGERDCTFDFYGDLDTDTDTERMQGRGYAGEKVKYSIKGKIVETTLTGKVEMDVVTHLKNGDMALTDLNPDLLKAIMAKYGKEKVKGGKTTFKEMYDKLNFTRMTLGNETFLPDDAQYIVEILDGTNDTNTIYEEEVVTGPPVKPTVKPGETTPKPAIPGSPAHIVININNINNIINNTGTIIHNTGSNNTNNVVNSGGGGSGNKPWWTKPTGTTKPSKPDNPKPSEPSQEDMNKFFEIFRKKLIDEASKHCPAGKTCRIKPAGTGGLTPFTNGGSFGSVGGSAGGGGGGGGFSPPMYPGLYPPYLWASRPPQPIIVVRSKGGACINSPFYGCLGNSLGRSAPGLEDIATNIQPFSDDIDVLKEDTPLSDVSSYLSHPGWKPLNREKTNISLDYENVPFIGFGYCPAKIVTPSDLTKILTNEDATSFYMDVVRTRCIPTERKYFEVLFHRKCLSLQTDKSLQVPQSCPHLKKQKLTSREFEELSRAFELHVFSKEIVTQLTRQDGDGGGGGTTTTSPDGRPISRSVSTLGKMVVSALTLYPVKAPNHSVKLTRNLVLTLKTAFIKALEDQKEINEGCRGQEGGCPVDNEVNQNDRIYLLSLAEFIVRGVGPKSRTVDEVNRNFDKFYKRNRPAIERRVADYNK